jgi:hypothetical protein
MGANIDGYYNTADGAYSMFHNTSGFQNTSIGSYSLFTNVNGSSNTVIGYKTDVASASLINATAVGAFAQVACSNCLVLGTVNGVNTATANTKVGIGLNSPLAPLHIKQSNEAFPVNGGGLRIERQTTSGHWDIGIDAGDDLDFTFNGITKTYLNNTTGGFSITSDLRLKKDILLIGTVLPSILQLQAKTYHYKDNNSDAPLSYGFIAQEVEKLFPDFVTTKGAEDMKAIAYQNFTVVAIKAIQEQQAMIEKMQQQIDILTQKIK